ncbi:hypothetical protein L1887_18379 [Cichorium endivia]|nr:hypothetical protein L1887_18379 [Cichorium endivia]
MSSSGKRPKAMSASRRPSGSTTSSSCSSNYVHAKPTRKPATQCFCRKPVRVRTSWTEDNPMRRFINCPDSLILNEGCKFFEWIDHETEDEQLRMELEKMKCSLLNIIES